MNYMSYMLNKIDKAICSYLGIDSQVITPNIVHFKVGRVFISNTESFKRHSYIETWDEFNASKINQVNPENKEKLGIAIGKALAKNLVISFERLEIEK